MPAPKESMSLAIRIDRLDDGEGYNLKMDINYNPEDPAMRDDAVANGVLGRICRCNETTPANVLTRIQSEATSAVTAFNNWADNYTAP
nr:hypothetical protein 30 [bacterium]